MHTLHTGTSGTGFKGLTVGFAFFYGICGANGDAAGTAGVVLCMEFAADNAAANAGDLVAFVNIRTVHGGCSFKLFSPKG